jgi:Ca2+-binding EF-hand superfamily protein
MSESYRLRKVLISIQDRIRALGSTNRNRWAGMTMEQTITFEKFYERIHFLGNDTSESDLRTIWFSLDFTNVMKYPDFLKFVSQDVEDFVAKTVPEEKPTNDYYDERNSRRSSEGYDDRNSRRSSEGYDDRYSHKRESITSQIRNSLQELCNLCIVSDSNLAGEISQRTFSDHCRKVGINVSDSEFQRLVRQNDTSGNGFVSYFLVVDQACHSDFDMPSDEEGNYHSQSSRSNVERR